MSATTCLVADPPWQFGDKLPGKSRGAERNYKVLTVADICAKRGFAFPELGPDCLLFLWRVAAMQQEALDVAKAWGFVVKSELIWQKLTPGSGKKHFGMGRYVRASHEVCLIAARGRGVGLIQNRSVRSTFEAPTGRHSEKPEEFYRIVETLTPGPYAELFARRRRSGWVQFGDQLPPSQLTARI